MRRLFFGNTQQRGSGLLLFAIVLVVGVSTLTLAYLSTPPREVQRGIQTGDALLQAKEALIGFAITYRYTHSNQAFGYLPCPDMDDDGDSEPNCGTKDVSQIGRFPWKTLKVPPLRDAASECLWYAVSGTAKDNPKTEPFNWDTPGQFILRNMAGKTLFSEEGNTHNQPLAVLFAPNVPLETQTGRQGGGNCGVFHPESYLEGLGTFGADTTFLTVADGIHAANNDRVVWITGQEIFDRIKRRDDFKRDVDTLMEDLAIYLNAFPPEALPVAAGNKGLDILFATYPRPAAESQKRYVFNNWGDHLLYIGGPTGRYFINDAPSPCRALLFFGGERTSSQIRVSAENKSNAAHYLEGSNAALFMNDQTVTGDKKYIGLSAYDPDSPAEDVIRCINGLAGGSVSFEAGQIGNFSSTGKGVTVETLPDTPVRVVVAAVDSSTTGGCLWYQTPLSLAGKTLRAYYEFQFRYADEFALGKGGQDRRYGIAFQMIGDENGLPEKCGKKNELGLLEGMSFAVETDIYKTSTHSDPSENHTAILINGNPKHASGTFRLETPTVPCRGENSGCRHTPANRFEESPDPLLHNQRIEITTGCDSRCESCNPAAHVSPNTYAHIVAWSDCKQCNDVAVPLDRALYPPTVQLCEKLADPEMHSVYIGLTAGLVHGNFPGQPPIQEVTFQNLSARSE